MAAQYKYPRPALTVDCVIFGFDGTGLNILLIKRGIKPYKDRWALPGGFIHENESLGDAALRELEEETGLATVYLEQLYTFGEPKRDPRERVVTVAYIALLNQEGIQLSANTDAKKAQWFPVDELPKLAFDHDEIFRYGMERLRNKVRYQPIGFELLPQKFALRELQHLYEVILQSPIDKRNFRKKILGTGLLIPLQEFETNVQHRAAQLHQFDKTKYDALAKAGFNFEL